MKRARRNEEEAGWTSVLTVWGPAEAAVIIARLRDEDIPAQAGPEAAYSAIPVTAGAIGAIRVMVPETEQERALEVLRDIGAFDEQD
ncbi:MAG: DUF2007 domain-containing protein [Anaerolineae bacterium]|nr:DUF2007 domain-containing protein [Anaerolineae bacterium]